MSNEDRFWNREELYEEVWSTPMRNLAEKYGLSDVGLAKTCRKLLIPLPGRGHWAKKEAGQTLKRAPLPPLKDRILIQRPTPREREPVQQIVANDAERAQLERLERSTGERELKRGSLSHPLIVQARAALARASADKRKILETSEPCMDIRVSKGSLDRAIRIMAGMIELMEAEGFNVAVGTGHREQTTATIYGQAITFGLVERVDRVPLTVAPRGTVLERVLTFNGQPVSFEPTGQLAIEIWRPWRAERKRWKDRKSIKLETLISQIVAGFIKIASAERAEREKHLEEQKERRRLAEERERLEQMIKAEQARVRALRQAAANWSRAEQIRSFLSAARQTAQQNDYPINPGTAFGDWLLWAEQQADRIDPLKQSPTSIIDRKGELEPRYVSYYEKKPEPPFRFPKPVWLLK